ncbi:MAG TPA: GreA/GreB family elongation factor [Pontiellaceae bacterium]|nr:GreA/GreB family elongation factor [Pontiellaceae bacterium]HPR83517.1 GreA/GreB family elongation factor [Pontiellaceae bacterium]
MAALTEEQLLATLEAETIPCADLLEQFDALCADGKEVRAIEWAELLKDTLTDRKLLDEAVAAYEWLALKQGTSPAISQKELLHILSTSRKEQKFIEPAFEKAASTEEAFSRLKHLRSMKKGMLCYSKTWGFGIINRVDPFYQKVEVAFEKKGDHELAFSYAATGLEVLTDDHLMAIRHKTPDEFVRLIKENPAEIIRITLRSYGPLSLNLIQDHLMPDVFATEADWKKFWDAARKDLKNDPLIEIPAKRTEPLRLRRKAKAYDQTWFEKFKNERDMPAVFQGLDEIQAQKIQPLEAYMAATIANRLAFAVKGGSLNQPGWIAQALVYAEQLGVEPEGVDCVAELTRLARRDDLPSLLEELPSRFMQAFINRLFTASETARSFLLRRLPEFGTTALNETVDALIRNGAETELAEQIRDTVRRRACSPALLLWILRNEERAEGWQLTNKADLAFQTIELIEQEHGGAALRAQNQLREQIEDAESLKGALAAMSDSQRRDFMRRISESPAWSKLDRQSLQAKIIKLCPDLHEVVLRKTNAAPKEKKQRITSKRSYQARKDQFEHILKKEIPENSKEIELARSYGDLRENSEFKFAKEKQRLLGLQAEELQKALDEVKPTDFADFPHDVAGIATGVELVYADGSRETYYILGEWDQDETLHIISSQAGMAKALAGAKAGSRVKVPTSSGEAVEVEIAAVTPLSEEIRNWLNG